MMFKVLKFGGSSVAGATAMSRVLDIVGDAARDGQLILVCSAISGCTDELIALGRQWSEEMSSQLERRHKDIIRRLFTGKEREAAEEEIHSLFEEMASAPPDERLCFGELFSTRIIARKLCAEGFAAKWLDSRKLIIKGDKNATRSLIRTAVGDPAVNIFVAPGFIASDTSGKVCTLGRGGSDYSAAIYAAATGASSLQIWTDVPGIMTSNPKTVPSARTIPQMSYQDALEMAGHGAKVLYAPTVAPAMDENITIQVLDTFDPKSPGTSISAVNSTNRGGWVGLASRQDGDSAEICLVGNGEENGIGRVSDTLIRNGIEPLGAVPEGRNILVRVRASLEREAMIALHREFFEGHPVSSIDLFIAGYGAVGKALVGMIATTASTVLERTGKALRIIGIGNTGCSMFDPSGIDPLSIRERLDSSPSEEAFVDSVLRTAAPGAIFVDCTSSETIYRSYEALMERGLNIVSSNRRSFAIPYAEYASIFATARSRGVFLRYETTVGAALPMLETVARGTNTCDEILSLEAVVSCTLNQILGDYSEGRGSFSSLLRKSQLSGLTEPDPRFDLAGKDALRKLLILAREAGIPLEEKDVAVQSLVPAGLSDIPLDEFYRKMESLEDSFLRTFRPRDGQRPRYVAVLEKDYGSPLGYKAAIEVRFVGDSHPAYQLRGTENAVIVRSSFHPYPLVISGAGEGAKQAASSILNDILR